VKWRAHATRVIASVDPLDLQHVRAKIGENGSGVGRRQNLPKLQDPQAGEDAGRFGVLRRGHQIGGE
jgi:hypothetical protein